MFESARRSDTLVVVAVALCYVVAAAALVWLLLYGLGSVLACGDKADAQSNPVPVFEADGVKVWVFEHNGIECLVSSAGDLVCHAVTAGPPKQPWGDVGAAIGAVEATKGKQLTRKEAK